MFLLQPCPDGLINSRAEQCAAFDRRPFRGRFYTWVPYIDGKSIAKKYVPKKGRITLTGKRTVKV